MSAGCHILSHRVPRKISRLSWKEYRENDYNEIQVIRCSMGNDAHGTAIAVPFNSILTIPDNVSINFKCIVKSCALSMRCYCYLELKEKALTTKIRQNDNYIRVEWNMVTEILCKGPNYTNLLLEYGEISYYFYITVTDKEQGLTALLTIHLGHKYSNN